MPGQKKKKNRQESKLLILAIPSVLKPIVQETETKNFRFTQQNTQFLFKSQAPRPMVCTLFINRLFSTGYKS